VATISNITLEDRLAAAEIRFERLRKRLGLVLAPSLFSAVLLIGIPGLEVQANRCAAILLAVITLWVTEAIPLPATALLGPAVAVTLGLAPARQAFAPFADPLILVFVGSFILAEAIFVHRLNERIAFGVMSFNWVGARPARILLAYAVIAGGLSMWISNTATTAMLMPLGLSLLTFMENEGKIHARYGAGLMLMTSYAATWGGIGTPVGTPPNIITIGMIERYAGIRIDFLQWMMLGVPLAAVMLVIIYIYLNRVANAGVLQIPGSDLLIRRRRAQLGPWSRGEKNVLIAFAFTVLLWIGPGLVPLFFGSAHPLSVSVAALMPESVAAILGAMLLFFLPLSDSERSTITWKQAANIDWGTILLFGGGLALGELAFSTKLAETMGQALTTIFPFPSLAMLTFTSAFFTLLLSEAMSNTAAANIAIPIVISMAQAANVNPLAPALAAGFAASAGFSLPVSTGPNALVYGTGKIPILRMVRYGILLDAIAIIVVPAMLLVLVPLVFGN
jgi:sodium-dependent dicarboxylate transporter 2/3/5